MVRLSLIYLVNLVSKSFSMLDGMFAISLWDNVLKNFFLLEINLVKNHFIMPANSAVNAFFLVPKLVVSGLG